MGTEGVTAKVMTKPVRERKPFWKLVLHYFGITGLAIGFAYEIIVLFIALIFKSDIADMIIPFSISAIASISLGLTLHILSGESRPLKLGEALSISALIWLFIPAIGSLPFIISGHLDPLSAYFESMSGFTATGLTMFSSVESLPKSLLIWRSLIQWIGGVGIIVLFLTVLGREGTTSKLYFAEGRTDRIRPSAVSTARWVWAIYSFYTVILSLLLILITRDAFKSINLSMTTLATGGFAVTDGSVASLDNPLAEGVIIFFMVIGATSFLLHYHVLVKGIHNPLGFWKFWRKKPVKEKMNRMLIYEFALMILLAVAGLITVSWAEGWDLRGGIFQSFSAITGTGLSNEDVQNYRPISKTVLSLLMISGGCYGSTTSAIKSFRVLLLLCSVAWIVKRKLLPEAAIVPLRIGGRTYKDEDVMDVAVYIFLYMGALIVGTLIFMGSGFGLENSLFEVASAQGNVGLSVGITKIGMPIYQKIVLMIEMWIGRLEIIPIFVLLRRLFPL